MLDEVDDEGFVPVELSGEAKRAPGEPGHAGSQGEVEALDVAGHPIPLSPPPMVAPQEDLAVGRQTVGIDAGMLEVDWGELLFEGARILERAVSEVNCHDPPALEVHRQPYPDGVFLAPDIAPHLIALEDERFFFHRGLREVQCARPPGSPTPRS